MAEGGAASERRPMTVAEFLRFEDGTDTRYELVAGRPVAMSPPKGRHVVIQSNAYDALRAKLPRPCRPHFGGGVALSDEGEEYRVPDVFVSCAPSVPDTYFSEPRLMVEVLSPTTAREDRTEKLDFYKSFPSVDAVVFVWQEPRRAELHLRQPGGGWLVTDAIGQGAVAVPPLGVELTLEELYADL